MKKAMVTRLGEYYGIQQFEEHGAKYPIRVFALKDEFTVCLDTSGESLHKRGYRLKQGLAPITETLAAALIMVSGWRDDHALVDPMCGSGTFAIEAAMIAANIAPGMDREFAAEAWTNIIDRKLWYNAVSDAEEQIDHQLLETGVNRFGKKVDIQGYDVDPEIIPVARENAERAGVDKIIHFQVRDVADFTRRKIRLHHHESAVWRENRGPAESAASLYGAEGSLSEPRCLVDACHHRLGGCREIPRKV